MAATTLRGSRLYVQIRPLAAEVRKQAARSAQMQLDHGDRSDCRTVHDLIAISLSYSGWQARAMADGSERVLHFDDFIAFSVVVD